MVLRPDGKEAAKENPRDCSGHYARGGGAEREKDSEGRREGRREGGWVSQRKVSKQSAGSRKERRVPFNSTFLLLNLAISLGHKVKQVSNLFIALSCHVHHAFRSLAVAVVAIKWSDCCPVNGDICLRCTVRHGSNTSPSCSECHILLGRRRTRSLVARRWQCWLRGQLRRRLSCIVHHGGSHAMRGRWRALCSVSMRLE